MQPHDKEKYCSFPRGWVLGILALFLLTGCGKRAMVSTEFIRTPTTIAYGSAGPLGVQIELLDRSCIELHEPTTFRITIINRTNDLIEEHRDVPVIDLNYLGKSWEDLDPMADIPYDLILRPHESVQYTTTITFTHIVLGSDGLERLRVLTNIEHSYGNYGPISGALGGLILYTCPQ